MSNSLTLNPSPQERDFLKSGKKFSDFWFLVLFFFSISVHSQIRDTLSVKGYLLNLENKSPIPSGNIILEENGVIILTKTDSLGYFNFTFNYGLFKTPFLYFLSSKNFKTNNAPNGFFSTEKKKITLEKSLYTTLEAKPLPECGLPNFPRVFFKKDGISFTDSTFVGMNINEKVYENSFDQILFMYQILIDNPTIVIELAGHCSFDENNTEQLSLYRVELVKQILISKGINENRLIIKSFGKKKLRTTEQEILKTKTKEEKEALHQLNRRVVFRIISWDYDNTKH